MKKKVLTRTLLGIPLGITISAIIPLIVSAAIGDGQYHAVAAELIGDFGSEFMAVFVQTLGGMLCGAAYAGSTVIWKMKSWSMRRRTATHAAVTFCVALPVAYLCRWMPHSVGGATLYLAIAVGIYVAIYLACCCTFKARSQK